MLILCLQTFYEPDKPLQKASVGFQKLTLSHLPREHAPVALVAAAFAPRKPADGSPALTPKFAVKCFPFIIIFALL